MEIKGFIEKAWDTEEGEPLVTKNDNPYGKILIQGKTLSIFDAGAFSALKALKESNTGVVIEVEQSGKYTNYKSHRGDSSMSQATGLDSGGGNGDAMSKDDWAMKDRRITRVAIAKSIIEATGQLFAGRGIPLSVDPGVRDYATSWFNWVYEQGTAPVQESAQSVPELPELKQEVEENAIFHDTDGEPIGRVKAMNDLTDYKGKSVRAWSKAQGVDKALGACSADELGTLFTAMRTEQEAI